MPLTVDDLDVLRAELARVLGAEYPVAISYLKLLSDKPNVAEAITLLAGMRPGTCALYHCAAGLDRTGIVSLLLLGAVSVPRSLIMCDYGYSFCHRSRDRRHRAQLGWHAAEGR